MSETTKQKLPECQLCHEPITDGLKLERSSPSKPLYVCYACFDVVNAIYLDTLQEWTAQKQGEKQ